MIIDEACLTQPVIPMPAKVWKHFRRLKGDELVQRGDFVETEREGLEPWEGPGGFRADTFLKPIFRRQTASRTAGGKSGSK